jgi:SAM-dependent methyltransferase
LNPLLRRIREWWLRTGYRGRLTRRLIADVGKFSGVILDVGGGRAAPHDIAWAQAVRRIRIDLSINHRPDIVADAARLPVRRESCDGVLMVEVLEHVRNPQTVIDEIYAVLRPGGRILGSVPFLFHAHGDPYDFFRYTPQGLEQLLAGFEGHEITPIGNRFGAAWTLVAGRSRFLRMFNPFVRWIGGRPELKAAEGYVFSARRPPPESDEEPERTPLRSSKS